MFLEFITQFRIFTLWSRPEQAPCVAVFKTGWSEAVLDSLLLYIVVAARSSCDSCGSTAASASTGSNSSHTPPRPRRAGFGQRAPRAGVIEAAIRMWMVAVIGSPVGFRLAQGEAGMSGNLEAAGRNKQLFYLFKEIKSGKMWLYHH